MAYTPKSFQPSQSFTPKSFQPDEGKEQPSSGGFLDSVKGMVVASRGNFESYDVMPREKFRGTDEEYAAYARNATKGQMQAEGLNSASKVLSFMGGVNPAQLGLSDLGITPFAKPEAIKALTKREEEAQKVLEEERQRNPVTNLAGGVLTPMGTGLKQMVPVAMGVGAMAAHKRGENPLAGGAVNAAFAVATHGAFKLGGLALSKLLAKQMHSTLGPEGPAFGAADDLERMAAQSGGTEVSGPMERGTVPDWRVGPGTAVGPHREVQVGPEVTKVARPGVRGEEITDVRTPRGERETMVSERPAPRPDETTNPGARVQHAERLAESPSTFVGEEPGVTNPGRTPRPGEVTLTDRPAISPGERLLRKAQRVPEGEPGTFVGPATAAERELSMAEAGKTRLIIPGVPESIEARAAEIEALAAKRGMKPVPQGIKNGQYPGIDEVIDVAPKGKSLGEPTFIEKSLQDGVGTKSLKVSVKGSAKFQAAMDFLTGAEPELEKTATKYVPRDSLLPKSQQNPEMTWVASKRLKGEIGGGSGQPAVDLTPNPEAAPTPGPPFEGPITPVDVPDSFARHSAEVAAALKKDKSLWETLRKGLSLPENRATDEVAAAIRSFKAARAMREQALKLHEKLNDSLKELSPADRARAQKVIVGLRDRKLGREAIDELPTAFKNLFATIEREKQEMLVSLAREGYFSPQEMLKMKKTLDDGQLHLHRSYQAFMAKKGYSPSAGAINEAARWIAQEQGLPEYEATREVQAIMQRLMEEGNLNGPSQLAAAFRDAGLLKSRTLPPALHKLLGVINDPSFIVADSFGEMAQMYHLARVTNSFASPEYQGKVWSPVHAEGFDPRRLWVDGLSASQNKQKFGELAGKYVRPELYEALASNASPHARAFWMQAWDAAVGWFAVAKVTASPVTWLRNLISNTYNLTVSGVPAYHYLDPRMVNRALQALKASKSRISMKEAGAGEWARMAMEDWAIPEGRGSDWGGSEAQRIIEESIRGSQGGLVGVMDKLFRKYNGARGKLGAAYEFADQLPRLVGYIYHVEQGVKLGMPEAAARARASQLINRYFATGASVGPLLRGIAQHGGAPFASWFVDNMRVAKNIGADAVRGDFGPLMRSALFMGGIAGGFQGLRVLGGFTDSDIAAGNRALKGSWDENNAFHDWLPFRGKKGEMYAVSFDGLNPMSAFFKGPEGHPAKNVAANIVKGLTQSGLVQMPADFILAQAGIRPEEYRPPVLPGQEGWALANNAWTYMQPTLVRQFRDVVRKAQLAPELSPLREGEEPQGFGESLLTTFNPLAIEKVGPRTQEAKRRQDQGAIGGLKDARKAVKRSDPTTAQEVREEANRRMEEKRKKQAR